MVKLILSAAIICGFLAHASVVGATGCITPEPFIDNKNGTLTDKRTGLMWKVCPETTGWNSSTGECSEVDGGDEYNIAGEMNYIQALDAAKNSRYLNFSDWRLPSVLEFRKIIGENCDSNHNGYTAASTKLVKNLRRPSFDTKYFGLFWTLTVDPSRPASAASTVGLGNGLYNSYEFHSKNYVRLVRNTKNASNKTLADQKPSDDAIRKIVRDKSILVGDTVEYDRGEYGWVGTIISEGDSRGYYVKIIQIKLGKYLHINESGCTSVRLEKYDVGVVIQTYGSCVKKLK